jgi:lysophospholipase L1-like esterase
MSQVRINAVMVNLPKSNHASRRSLHIIIILGTITLLIIGVPVTLHFAEGLAAAQNGIRIMPLGDSITFGEGSSYYGGYRVTLWKDLQAAHVHITFVGSKDSGPAILPTQANEGHPGARIDQISDHVVPWLHQYQPQIILLHIGTNDILQNYSVDTVLTRLQHLLIQITTTLPHAVVIVAQIIPLEKFGRDGEVIAYNKAIPGMVHHFEQQGKLVEYVDMYDIVPISDIPDQIHPNNQGYNLMASVWFTALKPILQFHKA